MLKLRPNCECCDKDLPPDAADALICTFECTFCADCAANRLAGRPLPQLRRRAGAPARAAGRHAGEVPGLHRARAQAARGCGKAA